jgi:DNA-binding response OmpR family regulator
LRRENVDFAHGSSFGVSQAHILIVDDDPKIRLLLRRCLEPEGYRVTEAQDGTSLFSVLNANHVDLITLDLTLGSDDGLEIARRVRSTAAVPIIMITGKGDTIDRIVGLELGADDYISKPFHVREVLARVRSVLRRSQEGSLSRHKQSQPSKIFRFANWVLDCDKRELRSTAGVLSQLTTAEFDLLAVLVQRPNRVLSRDTLLDLLKGQDWAAYDRIIDTQVARLRKKIEVNPEAPELIKTVRGIGYSFTADVTGS